MQVQEKKNLLAKEIKWTKPMECQYYGKEYLTSGLSSSDYEEISNRVEIFQFYEDSARTPVWVYSIRYLLALILIAILAATGICMFKLKDSLSEIIKKLPALIYIFVIALFLFIILCIYPILRFKYYMHQQKAIESYIDFNETVGKHIMNVEVPDYATPLVFLAYRCDSNKKNKRIYNKELRYAYFDEENLYLQGRYDLYKIPIDKINPKGIKIENQALPYFLFHDKPKFFNPGLNYLMPIVCPLYTIEIHGEKQKYVIQIFSENLRFFIKALEVRLEQSLPKAGRTASAEKGK
ncbi:MAG: hypothetical protein K2J85_07680 [Anaeroplasmataceae bacterium]|nr:hypothetical protein [Anaeroplasmataceae bacterium]